MTVGRFTTYIRMLHCSIVHLFPTKDPVLFSEFIIMMKMDAFRGRDVFHVAGKAEALERMQAPLRYAWGVVGHLNGVKNSDALREAHQAMQPRVIAASSSTTLCGTRKCASMSSACAAVRG